MRIDIAVIITIVVTHYADKVLDVFDKITIASIKKMKTKGKDILKQRRSKSDLKIRKRANVYQTSALKNNKSESSTKNLSEFSKNMDIHDNKNCIFHIHIHTDHR